MKVTMVICYLLVAVGTGFGAIDLVQRHCPERLESGLPYVVVGILWPVLWGIKISGSDAGPCRK